MCPYIKDKSPWIKSPDLQYFDKSPIQSGGLLFAALAYQEEDWLATWQQLNPKAEVNEMDRTYPIRQPIVWMD